jgi:hypothetical protein
MHQLFPQLRERRRVVLATAAAVLVTAAAALGISLSGTNSGQVPTAPIAAPKHVALCILPSGTVNSVITITGGLTQQYDGLRDECDYTTRSGWLVFRVTNLGPTADYSAPGGYEIPTEHYTRTTVDNVPVQIGYRGSPEDVYDAYLNWGGNVLWVYYTQNWADQTTVKQLVTDLIEALNGSGPPHGHLTPA